MKIKVYYSQYSKNDPCCKHYQYVVKLENTRSYLYSVRLVMGNKRFNHKRGWSISTNFSTIPSSSPTGSTYFEISIKELIQWSKRIMVDMCYCKGDYNRVRKLIEEIKDGN